MARFSAVLHREGRWYVSWCPDVDVASQGKTVEEALENLKEAVELYLEDERGPRPSSAPLVTTFEVSGGKAPRSVRA